MKPKVTLRAALGETRLLGNVLGDVSWQAWRVLLIAAMGEPLLFEELEVFTTLTGRTDPPQQRVDELWAAVGRRGGKTHAISNLAIYLAALCDHSDNLSPGEKAVVLLIAPDVRQAKIALDYAEGALLASPSMATLLANRTAETLTLTNGVTLEVRSASFRRIRGMTCVAVIADECAFWLSDESANPDVEILAAARPTLLTTKGPLIAISSPYARRGALWEAYRQYYGPGKDPRILVAQGTTQQLHPTVDVAEIEKALARDPAKAKAEYFAEFRTDIESYISIEALRACITGDRERMPDRRNKYVAFVDPSGGSSDSMTLAVAHKDGDIAVLDCVREVPAPFSPEAVVEEFAGVLQAYGVSKVVGDRYGGEWPREAFRKKLINYEISDRNKSEIYRDLLPLINSAAADLLDNDRLVTQFVGLERVARRGGRDSIDHAPGVRDDLANAAAGALVACAARASHFNDRIDRCFTDRVKPLWPKVSS